MYLLSICMSRVQKNELPCRHHNRLLQWPYVCLVSFHVCSYYWTLTQPALHRADGGTIFLAMDPFLQLEYEINLINLKIGYNLICIADRPGLIVKQVNHKKIVTNMLVIWNVLWCMWKPFAFPCFFFGFVFGFIFCFRLCKMH